MSKLIGMKDLFAGRYFDRDVIIPVSYTHLDVYKRQLWRRAHLRLGIPIGIRNSGAVNTWRNEHKVSLAPEGKSGYNPLIRTHDPAHWPSEERAVCPISDRRFKRFLPSLEAADGVQ